MRSAVSTSAFIRRASTDSFSGVGVDVLILVERPFFSRGKYRVSVEDASPIKPNYQTNPSHPSPSSTRWYSERGPPDHFLGILGGVSGRVSLVRHHTGSSSSRQRRSLHGRAVDGRMGLAPHARNTVRLCGRGRQDRRQYRCVLPAEAGRQWRREFFSFCRGSCVSGSFRCDDGSEDRRSSSSHG